MTAGFIIRVILEVIAVFALAYGYLHEDKLVAFEDRVLTKIRGRKAKNPGHFPRAVRESAENTDLGRVMQKTGALTMEEREARALEAAYCRNQAAAMRARTARAQTAQSMNSFEAGNTSHVA